MAQEQAGSGGPSRPIFRGVTAVKSNGVTTSKWRAQISYQSRTHALGDYDSEEEAARVYDRAQIVKAGLDDAKLNFPKEDYVADAPKLQRMTMDEMITLVKQERAEAKVAAAARMGGGSSPPGVSGPAGAHVSTSPPLGSGGSSMQEPGTDMASPRDATFGPMGPAADDAASDGVLRAQEAEEAMRVIAAARANLAESSGAGRAHPANRSPSPEAKRQRVGEPAAASAGAGPMEDVVMAGAGPMDEDVKPAAAAAPSAAAPRTAAGRSSISVAAAAASAPAAGGLSGLSALVAAVEQPPQDAAVSAEAAAMLTLLAERDQRVEAALAAVPAVPLASMPELGLPLEGLAQQLADAGAFDNLLAGHKQAVRRATGELAGTPGGAMHTSAAAPRQPARQVHLLTQQMTELLNAAEAEYNNMQGQQRQQQQQAPPGGPPVATHLAMASQHFASERALHAVHPAAAARATMLANGSDKENSGSAVPELQLVLPASHKAAAPAGLGPGLPAKAGRPVGPPSVAAQAAQLVQQQVRSGMGQQHAPTGAQHGGPLQPHAPLGPRASVKEQATHAGHGRSPGMGQQAGGANTRAGGGVQTRPHATGGPLLQAVQHHQSQQQQQQQPPPRRDTGRTRGLLTFTGPKRARLPRQRSQSAADTMQLLVRYVGRQPLTREDARVLLVLLALPHAPMQSLHSEEQVDAFLRACAPAPVAAPAPAGPARQPGPQLQAGRAAAGGSSGGGAQAANRLQAVAAAAIAARQGARGPPGALQAGAAPAGAAAAPGPQLPQVPRRSTHGAGVGVDGLAPARQPQAQPPQVQAQQPQVQASESQGGSQLTTMMLPNGQMVVVPQAGVMVQRGPPSNRGVVMQGPHGPVMVQLTPGQQLPGMRPPQQQQQHQVQQQQPPPQQGPTPGGQAAAGKQQQTAPQQQQQQPQQQVQAVYVQGPGGQLQQVQLPPGMVLAPQMAGGAGLPPGAVPVMLQQPGSQGGAAGQMLMSLPTMMQLPNGQLVPARPAAGGIGPAAAQQQQHQQQPGAASRPGAQPQSQQQEQQQQQQLVQKPQQLPQQVRLAAAPTAQQQQQQQQHLQQQAARQHAQQQVQQQQQHLLQQATRQHAQQQVQQQQQQQQQAGTAAAAAGDEPEATYDILPGANRSPAEIEVVIRQMLKNGQLQPGSHVVVKDHLTMMVQPPAQPPATAAAGAQQQQQQHGHVADDRAAGPGMAGGQQARGPDLSRLQPGQQQARPQLPQHAQYMQQQQPAQQQQQQQQLQQPAGFKVVNGVLVPADGPGGGAAGGQQQQQQQRGAAAGGAPRPQQPQQQPAISGLPPGTELQWRQGSDGRPVPVLVPAGSTAGNQQRVGGTAAPGPGGLPPGAVPVLMQGGGGSQPGMMPMFPNLPPGTVLVNGPNGQTVMLQQAPRQAR